MHTFVDFAWFIHVENIVPIYIMFGDKIHATKRCDQRARDTEHHSHTKYKHHSCILLTYREWLEEKSVKCSNFPIFLWFKPCRIMRNQKAVEIKRFFLKMPAIFWNQFRVETRSGWDRKYMTRFELTTSCLQDKRFHKLSQSVFCYHNQ